jgi:hypothetical protein
MAKPQDYFMHLLQAYSTLDKDPSQRRAVGDKVVEFLGEEGKLLDFTEVEETPELPIEADDEKE